MIFEYAEFSVRCANGRVYAEGVVLLQGGEPVGLVGDDIHAHEGVSVIQAAELLRWMGAWEIEGGVEWTVAEFEDIVKSLGEERAIL